MSADVGSSGHSAEDRGAPLQAEDRVQGDRHVQHKVIDGRGGLSGVDPRHYRLPFGEICLEFASKRVHPRGVVDLVITLHF